MPAIVDWYRSRDLPPRLAVADRLLPSLRPRRACQRCWCATCTPRSRSGRRAVGASRRLQRANPRDVLTAVVDGELIFGTHADAAARAAVTDAPDGTRWVGLSALHEATPELCETLLAWGARAARPAAICGCADDDRADRRPGPVAGLRPAPSRALHHGRGPHVGSRHARRQLRLATWNVNSIRTRLPRVLDWLARGEVDVLAMQETKCSDDQFPTMPFLELGYEVAHCRFQPVERRGDRVPGRPGQRRSRLRRPADLEQQTRGGRRGRSPRAGRHLRRGAGVEPVCAQRSFAGRSALHLQIELACRPA